MPFKPAQREELKELIREVVREELLRMQDVSEHHDIAIPEAEEDTIDNIAARLFDRYDDVFKALA